MIENKSCGMCKKSFRIGGKITSIKQGIEHGLYDNVSMFPSEYDYEDRVCVECVRKWEGLSKGIEENFKNKCFYGESALLYKSEWCAVLHQTQKNWFKFIVEFDRLTRDGYKCVAQDEGVQLGVSLGVEITGGLNSYYYFQNIKWVGVGSR